MENLHDVLYVSNSATQAGTEFNFNTLFRIWKCQKTQTAFGTVQAQIRNIRLQDDEIHVPSEVDQAQGHTFLPSDVLPPMPTWTSFVQQQFELLTMSAFLQVKSRNRGRKCGTSREQNERGKVGEALRNATSISIHEFWTDVRKLMMHTEHLR